ncbi:hypothetical protein NP233_g11796 [Leucocoprinus birnbaumii]|uniref:Uncharacterized protein n=1 Tax=Leucocoprinus birnbaumii TaxID=56174 RepID=A0AAD5VFQ4_9AGAR|nr:hypothetical protein NP233_g11796 [Leucocoprinus birnbaumii]
MKLSVKVPGSNDIQPESNIVDSLYKNFQARRGKWLGLFIRTWDVDPDDFLGDPTSVVYTDEINDALSPHLSLLQVLIDNPTLDDVSDIPALQWLMHTGRDPERDVVQFTGNLSEVDIAGVNNWMEKFATNGNS